VYKKQQTDAVTFLAHPVYHGREFVTAKQLKPAIQAEWRKLADRSIITGWR